MLDYPTLKVVWWGLIGILLIGFAIMDGHDLGIGTLLPFVGRTDVQRRIIINTVEAHWEGNQVWLITAGGAIFAAWPLVYAAAFSGFYWAMLAVLWTLFLRPVGFHFRNKIHHQVWRKAWDWGLFVSGTIPPFIFGVAFGNLLLGVPFYFDSNMLVHYTGTFWQLLNPFSLLCGVVSTAMIVLQGAVYLAYRTEGSIQSRARSAAVLFGLICLLCFSLAGVWLAYDIPGYVITSAVSPAAEANPLAKTVMQQAGAWFTNYHQLPHIQTVPILAYVGVLLSLIAVWRGWSLCAFIASSVGLAGIIATAGVAMFPFVMPSSTHFASSLTVWDSTSSKLTLWLMLWAVIVFMPLILLYTGWAYKVMSGKITDKSMHEE